MKSLLTGSRVYGEPRPDSDIDMVILAENADDRIKLMTYRDHTTKTHVRPGNVPGYNGVSLRYGNLNIILVDDPKVFEAWEKGTNFLKAIAPVTHEQACLIFETMFKVARGEDKVPF